MKEAETGRKTNETENEMRETEKVDGKGKE